MTAPVYELRDRHSGLSSVTHVLVEAATGRVVCEDGAPVVAELNRVAAERDALARAACTLRDAEDAVDASYGTAKLSHWAKFKAAVVVLRGLVATRPPASDVLTVPTTNDVLAVLDDLPLGHVGDQTVQHRATTTEDVAAWVRRVCDLRVRLRASVDVG